ncbi:hypothetical protein [Caldivirga maquilingensis]|uniref:hypothetical protein n=1 Tax=Caldivirga maquilingensis TaxID=76887 RepID=UPI001E2C83A5|nr:hypothetical protein [Caldivirga maquilingensis]
MRLLLRLRRVNTNNETLVKAIVNTGFISDDPEIALPIVVAERLGLWPRPSEAINASLDTGGGSVEVYVVPRSLIVNVITEDKISDSIIANALIDPYIDETLINDALTEELRIEILSPRSGLWRFSGEAIIRRSAQ